MCRQYLRTALLAAFAFASPLLAQITLPGGVIAAILEPQSYTTGMVGFTTNQTARLVVLNLNPVEQTVASLTPPASCTVQLQFLDSGGNPIGAPSVVPNFAPGTATGLDLPRAGVLSVTATPRAEIRGVVSVNPTPAPAGTPAITGYCSVMTTLEIYDSTTGSTVSSTSDTRPTGFVR